MGTSVGGGTGFGLPHLPQDSATPSPVTDMALGIVSVQTSLLPTRRYQALLLRDALLPLANGGLESVASKRDAKSHQTLLENGWP